MKKIINLLLILATFSGCNIQNNEPDAFPISIGVGPSSTPSTSAQASPVQQITDSLGNAIDNSTPPSLTTNQDNTQATHVGAKDLLLSHGWTVTKILGLHEVILPTTLIHSPGNFPLSIYWAYNNELSSEIDLNYTPYLGTNIRAIIYSLEEDPPCLQPYTNARGIVLLSGGKLIGAWIDSGNNLNTSCSLTGKTFPEVIGLSWGEWLVDNDIVDTKNNVDNKLAKMSPAQLVLSFYDEINKHDYILAFAHYSREKLSGFMFTNLQCCVPGGEGKLFQRTYEEAVGSYGIENIKSIKIDEATLVSSSSDEIIIKVSGEIEYYRESPPHIVNTNAYQRYISLKHEIDGLGYRISNIGTGP